MTILSIIIELPILAGICLFNDKEPITDRGGTVEKADYGIHCLLLEGKIALNSVFQDFNISWKVEELSEGLNFLDDIKRTKRSVLAVPWFGVSSSLWNRIGAKGSNCPFSVKTKFGKQTNIAALFKKTTKLYGKLASSKGAKSRDLIVTAHKFKRALQGCFASRAQVALIDYLFNDSGYQKSEIDAISRLQSSILKIKPRRRATYRVPVAMFAKSTSRPVCQMENILCFNSYCLDVFTMHDSVIPGMCALDMITEHPSKIAKVFNLNKDILLTSDRMLRPKLGYLQNNKTMNIVQSSLITWFTDAMKGSPTYVNGGSSGEIYFSSLGGVWEKNDKIVEGLSNQSLT
ncbi:hypothetical protein HELRODRAFT_184392 [Helobdella robusta]|uniref:Uncharacterized protein n=1 Tax=Helobdella robusta TaxID=6412 RepID=T1FL40_HELRO|nr:hypothetical protein HELRODRAFT_184392 [Helobdella robusta]ESN99490.1 hypothetical protein HELRODRAFT_184392 [Helobdella robusta]